MCSVRHRPIPSAPRSRAFVGLVGRVGVRTDAQAAALVRVRHQASEGPPQRLFLSLGVALASLLEQRFAERQFAHEHVAGEPVDRDHVALGDRGPVRGEPAPREIQLDRVGAADGRDAFPAGHHRRVRVRAAGARQDALGRDHAVVIVRRGLATHQDDLLATVPPLLRLVGAEDDLPGGRAGRGVQALRDGRGARVVDPPLEELLETVRVDAEQGGVRVDQVVREHVVGHDPLAERGALADARLQDPEPALLDRELDVAHVAVVLLERVHHVAQLAVRRRDRSSRARRA